MRHARKVAVIAGLLGLIVTVWVAGQARAEGKKKPRRIEVSVTEKGFEPDQITVKKGEPLLLVFTRKTETAAA